MMTDAQLCSLHHPALEVEIDFKIRVDPTADPHLYVAPSMSRSATSQSQSKSIFRMFSSSGPTSPRKPFHKRPMSAVIPHETDALAHRLMSDGRFGRVSFTFAQLAARDPYKLRCVKNSFELPIRQLVQMPSNPQPAPIGLVQLEAIYIPPIPSVVPRSSLPQTMDQAVMEIERAKRQKKVKHASTISQLGAGCLVSAHSVASFVVLNGLP